MGEGSLLWQLLAESEGVGGWVGRLRDEVLVSCLGGPGVSYGLDSEV